MTCTPSLQDSFKDILYASEIIDKTSPHFTDHSVPWSLAYDRSPQLVLVPSSIEYLQTAVQRLCELDVDFAVRGRGVGSSSARDVILSMRSFDEIKFDENSSTVVIGAGLDWGQVDGKLATLVRSSLTTFASDSANVG